MFEALQKDFLRFDLEFVIFSWWKLFDFYLIKFKDTHINIYIRYFLLDNLLEIKIQNNL